MSAHSNVRRLTIAEVDLANAFASKRGWTVEHAAEEDGDCLHFTDAKGKARGSIGTQEGLLHTVSAMPRMRVKAETPRIEAALAAI